MDKERKQLYETKLEHLTFGRVILIYGLEILLEFCFGLVFQIQTFLDYNIKDTEEKKNEIFIIIRVVAFIYLCDFGLATINFIVGLFSLCCCTGFLTKFYVYFNNIYKTVNFNLSLGCFIIVSYYYFFKKEKFDSIKIDNQLKLWIYIWIIYQFIILGIVFVAMVAILSLSICIYCRRDDYEFIELIDKSNFKSKFISPTEEE